MRVRYGMLCEEYTLDNRSRTTYGIAAYATPDDARELISAKAIHDICPDKAQVQYLVEMCNDKAVALVHFTDVVTDYLT